MTDFAPPTPASAATIAAIEALETRLRWLSAWTIHNANHLRDSRDGLKVGGHQASCASITAIMSALYFHALPPQDKGGGEAARRAGAARDPLSARQSEPRPAAALPRPRWRTELSEPHQGQGPGRLFDRLGRPGRRIETLLDAFAQADDDKPMMFIAYTVKGYGLPFAGHKDNPAGLMNPTQIHGLRDSLGIAEGSKWERSQHHFRGLLA